MTNTQTMVPPAMPGEVDEEEVKIAVNNVNFWYGGFHAIHDVSMPIMANKVTAFIGPSGCGKSTLLRIFNLMYRMYPGQRAEGEVMLDGENLLTTKTPPALIRARVGMVFQKPTPFPMSIYDNIAFGVNLFEKLSKKDMDERIEWALTKAALWNEVKDKLDQSGYGLSGGQQQRLCIARAIAVKPEVLLMDEPCSALDPISTMKIEGPSLPCGRRWRRVPLHPGVCLRCVNSVRQSRHCSTPRSVLRPRKFSRPGKNGWC